MTFDEHVGLGAVIEIIMLGIGIVGGWFTLKAVVKATIKELDALQRRFDSDAEKNAKQHDDNQRDIAEIKLQIARDTVKIEDFRRLEDRISTKFEKVEHTVNNASLKTVALVKDLFRDVLPPMRGRE